MCSGSLSLRIHVSRWFRKVTSCSREEERAHKIGGREKFNKWEQYQCVEWTKTQNLRVQEGN